MEKEIFATIKMDMETIDKALKDVIDAHEALRAAIYRLDEAAQEAETIKIK